MIQAGAYSFLDVNATISGPGGDFSLSAAGVSDEGISIALVSEKNTMTIGAAGDGMHSLKATTAVRVSISLLKTGTGNALMNAMYRYQELSSARWGQNTITVTNAVTGDSALITAGAFTKHPDVRYGAEGGMMIWTFDAVSSQIILGDSYQTTSSV